LVRILELPPEAQTVLMKPPHRMPAQPWPPTDPFVYRLYEVVLLHGPVFKDVAHELFGDGIMSAIDMSVDIEKVEDPASVPRMALTLNGKWLQYKKF
jgi:cyanate lyase